MYLTDSETMLNDYMYKHSFCFFLGTNRVVLGSYAGGNYMSPCGYIEKDIIMSKTHHLEENTNPFEARAAEYDAWFDTDRGQAIFNAEAACLRRFVINAHNPWLEIGVGTGRFAEALGVEFGIDPSKSMLEIADKRGIKTQLASGESLPYPDSSFGGVMIAFTLCFLEDPSLVLKEAARVLRPDGRLAVGIVPAESSWGKSYIERGEAGHPIYKKARLLKVEEAISLIKAAGFEKRGVYSTLMKSPDSEIENPPIWPGILPMAGFVAMGFSIKDATGQRSMENVPY